MTCARSQQLPCMRSKCGGISCWRIGCPEILAAREQRKLHHLIHFESSSQHCTFLKPDDFSTDALPPPTRVAEFPASVAKFNMANNWQEEAMRRLRQMQQQGGPKRGGPQMPRGMGGLAVGSVLLAGGAMFLSNALFNVDGGHRAIKYKRMSGVSPEIYNEGVFPAQQCLRDCRIQIGRKASSWTVILKRYRNSYQHSLVRDSDRL